MAAEGREWQHQGLAQGLARSCWVARGLSGGSGLCRGAAAAPLRVCGQGVAAVRHTPVSALSSLTRVRVRVCRPPAAGACVLTCAV